MTEQKTRRLSPVTLIAIAALAGIVAGAVGVYLKAGGSGNAEAPIAANEVQGVKACEGSVAKAQSLLPFSRGQVAAMAPVDTPRQLPKLTFKGADGADHALQSFAGKTVLFNLWATWCVPCREEMPALNALQKTLGSEGGGDKFQVVAVNIDTGGDDNPKQFLEQTGVDALGFYRDSSMGVFNELKKEGLALGLPVTLLFDDKGCLLASMNGPAAWDSEDGKAMVKAAAGL
ncbi:TlpA family protein disulfide reductase [Rhizobium sp. CFBP 8762]|uniref:thiol:disulfide interchange protein TlpA n=1 Tax=Rhizobium sp. CFBP 8762 TaxID=2775279 RepID=UPI00177D433C|nr:TlpA disulfide reductase family protein [Rhizobium sp. CFBP 8762]MBD8555627.1 TlpA family protein disulfide reductase [Rhizobium sp. CFBP 8762]